MEKIKIGQYIRTKKGRIAKITTINEIKYTYHTAKARNRIKFVGQKRTLINGRYEFEDIKKQRQNIEDLIETGDYVNGCLVLLVDETTFTTVEKSGGIRCHYKKSTKNIHSIVTHEQFEAAKYEVNHASNIT